MNRRPRGPCISGAPRGAGTLGVICDDFACRASAQVFSGPPQTYGLNPSARSARLREGLREMCIKKEIPKDGVSIGKIIQVAQAPVRRQEARFLCCLHASRRYARATPRVFSVSSPLQPRLRARFLLVPLQDSLPPLPKLKRDDRQDLFRVPLPLGEGEVLLPLLHDLVILSASHLSA